jgi:hypothetical protein
MSKQSGTEFPTRICKINRKFTGEYFLTYSDDANTYSNGSDAATVGSVSDNHLDNLSTIGQLQIVERSSD